MGIPFYETLNFLSGKNLGSGRLYRRGKPIPGYAAFKRNFDAFKSRWGPGRAWRGTGKPKHVRDWINKPSKMKGWYEKRVLSNMDGWMKRNRVDPKVRREVITFAQITGIAAGAYATEKGRQYAASIGVPTSYQDVINDLEQSMSQYGLTRVLGSNKIPYYIRDRRKRKILKGLYLAHRYGRRFR